MYFAAFICYLSSTFSHSIRSQPRRRQKARFLIYFPKADTATILLGGTSKTHLADKPFALFSLNLDCLYLRARTMFFFAANRLLVHDVSDQIELRCAVPRSAWLPERFNCSNGFLVGSISKAAVEDSNGKNVIILNGLNRFRPSLYRKEIISFLKYRSYKLTKQFHKKNY